MQLTVARIGRAHGLRGEVALDMRTDNPEARLVVGSTIDTEPAEAGPLTIERARLHQGKWLVTFAGVTDRSAAERMRGITLVVEADVSDEEDAWYPHELVGLRVELEDGTVVGEVLGLEHLPAHDLLVIRETDGARTRVPFVHAIVPVVDVPGGRVVLDPPGGLLARDADRLEVAEPTPGSGDLDDDAAGTDGTDGTND